MARDFTTIVPATIVQRISVLSVKTRLGSQGGDANLYSYVKDSPINYRDPAGEWNPNNPNQVYGQWCGPDWTGGQPEPYNPEHNDLYNLPDDAVDAVWGMLLGRFNDPTGLSAADIGRIGGACQKCTDQLTQSGERLEGSGWWNGELNNAAAAIGWGNHYSGCDRQANLTASCLNFPSSPPGYDNSWTFTVESTHWGLHRVTIGRSNNPFDPVVICDSWMNTFTSVPSF